MNLTDKQKEARKKLYDDVNDNWPLRKGKNEFLKALSSQNLTRKEAMLAACYHCYGGYEAGVKDCAESICPLYHHMPYREASEREAMPEEQKVQLIARLKRGREAANAGTL